MARRKENILDVLVEMPWQTSVVLSAVVFITFRFILPLLPIENPLLANIALMLHNFAFIFALILLVPAPISAFNANQKRKQIEAQKDINTIRELDWWQFEELVAEAYRRKGYSVVENQGPGPDGGVDIRLHKDGQTHLVQCKQWKSRKVGVPIVREMYGIMTAEKAASVTVVTSGIFTQEAKNFALGKPIDLVDGGQLTVMVRDVQTSDNVKKVEPAAKQMCPQCGAELVLRTAQKGKNAGKQFRGCSSFPKCRYTEDVK